MPFIRPTVKPVLALCRLARQCHSGATALALSQQGALPHLAGTGISRGAWALALAALLAAGHVRAESCGPAVAPMLERIGATVWRVPASRGEADVANGGQVTQLVLVRDGARLWLIGSGPTPAYGKALACAIRAALRLDVTDVVNTRAQPELAMGNAAFPRARLWALPDVARAMRTQCRDCLARLEERVGTAGDSLAPEQIRVPTHHVGRIAATAGTLGPFRWFALPRAAGARTLVLQLPAQRLLIAQGLVWSGALPHLRDTDSALMLAGLRRLAHLAPGQRVIGEQGDVGTAADIARHVAYLQALRASVRERIERGEVDAGAAPTTELEVFGATTPEDALTHALNRQRVWRELEARWFR